MARVADCPCGARNVPIREAAHRRGIYLPARLRAHAIPQTPGMGSPRAIRCRLHTTIRPISPEDPMDITAYTDVPADHVKAGDIIVTEKGTFVVNETRHIDREGTSPAVELLVWPPGVREGRRGSWTYKGDDPVRVSPAGATAINLWDALLSAVRRAERAWVEDRAIDSPGDVPIEAAPWLVDGARITIRFGGRTWTITDQPILPEDPSVIRDD